MVTDVSSAGSAVGAPPLHWAPGFSPAVLIALQPSVTAPRLPSRYLPLKWQGLFGFRALFTLHFTAGGQSQVDIGELSH